MAGIFSRSGRQVVLRASCFGKLPLHDDFLAWRGLKAGERFQQWLGHLNQSAERPATLPRSRRILFPSRNGRELVVGTVWDSRDGVGRPFPFALYLEPPDAFLEVNRSRPVLACAELWASLERRKDGLAAATSTGDFYDRLGEVVCSVPLSESMDGVATFEEGAARIRAADMARAVFGEDPGEAWARLLWSLAVACGAQAGVVVPSLALRLPLGRGIPYVLQAEAWIQMIRDRAGDAGLVPAAILPAEPTEGPAALALVFRPLRDADARLLQDVVATADLVDMSGVGDAIRTEVPEDFRRAALDWLESPGADLRRLLDRESWTAARP